MKNENHTEHNLILDPENIFDYLLPLKDVIIQCENINIVIVECSKGSKG